MHKIAFVTFTCKRDFERAKFHAPAFGEREHVVETFWVVESKDVDAAKRTAPPGVRIVVSDFDRGPSLRGEAAVCGMANVFRQIAADTGCDVLIKLDSDTELFDWRTFAFPVIYSACDFVYIRRLNIESRLLANGCCYAMSRRAIERLSSLKPPFAPVFSGHEDLIFSEFFTCRQRDLTLCQINKMRWSWSESPYIAADCLGAHNGYLSLEEDKRVTQEIRNLKLLKVAL